MVVHQDHGCGVVLQCCLDNLAWIDAGTVERASEQFLEGYNSMSAIKVEKGKTSCS